MEENMIYQGFVKGAFSIKSETLIERFGDRASLANTDVFHLSSNNLDYLNRAK